MGFSQDWDQMMHALMDGGKEGGISRGGANLKKTTKFELLPFLIRFLADFWSFYAMILLLYLEYNCILDLGFLQNPIKKQN